MLLHLPSQGILLPLLQCHLILEPPRSFWKSNLVPPKVARQPLPGADSAPFWPPSAPCPSLRIESGGKLEGTEGKWAAEGSLLLGFVPG